MGTSYTIHCKHCGAHFHYSSDESFGLLPRCVGCGNTRIETQAPIRCPACLHRLNTTEEEFNEQVETIMMWD